MVIIIGAGLSGLLTAYRLKKAGQAFKVLEARDRQGGRIHTILTENGTALEMGATWFHPEDRFLTQLLAELKIPYYEQYMEGRAYFQARSAMAPEAFVMPSQTPSYRIAGGTGNLIDHLMEEFEDQQVFLNQPVHKLDFYGKKVVVHGPEIHEAEKVVLTLPPRLWEQRIKIVPGLPKEVLDAARNTHTWMQESMKIALTYSRPFWREREQSGALFSNEGPMTELYDHCNDRASRYALCGFLHPAYKNLEPAAREQAVLNQLESVFGREAASCTGYRELNWSDEEFTCEQVNIPLYPHQNNGNPLFQQALFDGRLLLSGTETSEHRGGYMEGAVYASLKTVSQLLTSS